MTDQHQCPLLASRFLYLELLSEGRWVLKGQNSTEGRAPGDDCVLTIVLYCPGCGKDCRPETVWRPANDPELRAMLEEALTPCPSTPESERRIR